jgi:3D (Asp-Asp-Asp) domain-containing protein
MDMNKIIFASISIGVVLLALVGFDNTETIQYIEPAEVISIEDVEEVEESQAEQEELQLQIENEEKAPEWVSLGTFKTTAYCPCSNCCGKSNGITASGTIATPERTIAADTSILPFGSIVNINGKVYVVEDTGGSIKGNRIDIFFATHQEALEYGVGNVEVFVMKE